MYLLDPKTMRVRLRKDAEQFSLFGGDPTPVALTSKGQRAKKQREKWGTQTELFPSNQFSVPTLKPKAPKAAKQPLKPKAPKATLKPKAKEGDTRINRAGNQEVLRSGRWRLISKDAPVAPGLAVLRDEPAAVAPPVAAVEAAPANRKPVSPKEVRAHIQGKSYLKHLDLDVFWTEDGQIQIKGRNGIDETFKTTRAAKLWVSKLDNAELNRRANAVATRPAPAPAAVEPEPTTIAEAIRQNKAEGKRRAGLNPDNFKPEVGQQFNIAGNDLKRSQGDWQIFAIRDGVVSLGRLKDGKLTNPSAKNLFTVTTEQLNAIVTTGSAVLKDAPEPTPVSTPEPTGAAEPTLQPKGKATIPDGLPSWVQNHPSFEVIQGALASGKPIATGAYVGQAMVKKLNPPSKRYPSGSASLVSVEPDDRQGMTDTLDLADLSNRIQEIQKKGGVLRESPPINDPKPTTAPAPTAPAEPAIRKRPEISKLPDEIQERIKDFQAQATFAGFMGIAAKAKLKRLASMSNEEIIEAFQSESAPAEPPAPTLETDADFASTKRQEDRIVINQQVRELLAQKPDGPYTQDEMTLLAKYSGKGGITQDEGSLSEYYTRPDVAKFTTDLLYQNGYKGGVVLEPSCGNGVFLRQLKGDSNTLAVGVELDSTSGTCAARLNPHADVNHGVPFERFLLDNPNFTPDAIVGNVPFGTRTVPDLEAFRKVGKGWKDNGDFFVHESLSRLKPGGTMALIVPHGITTGKNHAKLRRELMKQGRVVGAYRLPNTAFSHTGTQTITDILVIQKHPDPVLNAIAQKDKGAIAATRDDTFIHGKYFEENPEHILGTVRATTNQYGGESFTVDGSVEDALAKAPPLAPKVSYDGLNLPTQDDDGPQQGDEKYIGGRLYRFEGHPGRWHLVQPGDGVEAEEGADPSAYGTGSVAEAEAMLKDPGQRVMIDPENLRAFAQLAGATLTPAEAAAVKEASMAVDQMGSTVDKAKLAHAMLLAGHLQRLQKLGTDDPIHLEQALAMLQAYREAHGNPATDRSLSALAKQLPTLLHLQGAFDEEGTVSDYFANHKAVMEQAKRSHSEAGAAMGEAFRAAGGEAVTLGEIRQHLEGTMTDDDLAAALAADPTVGYMGGGYKPLERLLVGNGFNLIDAFLMEAETLPEGSPLRRKLEEQVGMVRARLQPRAMEDITTPFWAVGSWIPVDALNAFLEASDYRLRVKYDALASEWRAVGEGGWGIGEDILTTMNRGRISHGINTKEAKEAIAALEQQFGQWLSGSDYRLQVEEAYNIAFNGDLPQEFSGEPLDIPLFEQHGGDPENGVRAKRLHDYQNSTIRQMAEQGRGIIALGVGLGKTATSIGLALHLKGQGRAKKPTFVVPKSVLANWVREIDFWAPGANVMILGQTQQFWQDGTPAWEVPGHKIQTEGGVPKRDKDGNYVFYEQIGAEEKVNKKGDVRMVPIYADTPTLMTEAEYLKRGNLAFKDDDAATKKLKMRQLSQNSYDIVLMSEPVFQTIKLSTDKEQAYLDDIAQSGVGHVNPDAKKTRDRMEQVEKRRTKLADRTGETEDTITFEELGIDALFHDEAHHLKNLYGTQRSGDVAFLSQAESDRSLDFYYKARYIREQNNNQNCYLLTATPTTNNPLEAFNMLQHVCPEEFEARGIQNIDDFLGMFGKIESVTVPGVDLEMTEKNGLVGFKNLKDLRHLFNKYTRMQSAKDVGLPIPEELTQDHYVDMTDAQKEVYADLKVRAQKVQEDENDHIFSIISDMDKAAIDLNYYNQAGSGRSQMGQMAEGERSPKIEECANQVMSSRAGNGGKQIVFCDAVQLHEDLKRQLVEAGYPEDEIAIVNAGTVPKSSDRQKISQAYNSGRISLVIGNTATMGEGMNFQIGTTDIHHLTTPWTPAAIEQRNGRGVRQGNELDGVNCHYYHAKGSFDGYRKGVVERKRGWIDDLWRGDADEATNQNTGALSMDDIELMMADDPEAARAKLEANKEVQMARHSAKMTGQALKQFANLQTMKLAHSKMPPDQRNSERGRALADRIRATAEALGRNQHFPHKDLLDGSAPAYVGTDGTVLRVGDHVQKSDGSVFRIQAIDPSSGKLETINVSGSDSSPNTLEKNPRSIKFDSVNKKGWEGVKPIPFDTAAHAERVISKLSTYSEVARLDPDTINANRDRLLDRLKDGGYSRVPYLDPKTNLVEEARITQVPEGAQILWPHDGEALEHCLRTMGDPAKEGQEWRYHDIAASLMGQGSWYGVAAELKPRIEAYREQHKAMAEQGPKEGDTRINSAGNQEVFRSGRWHRVGDDAPAQTTVGNPDEHPAITGMRKILAQDGRVVRALKEPGNSEKDKREFFAARFKELKGRLVNPEYSGFSDVDDGVDALRVLLQDKNLYEQVSSQLFNEMSNAEQHYADTAQTSAESTSSRPEALSFDGAVEYLQKLFPTLRVTLREGKGGIGRPAENTIAVFDDAKQDAALAFFRRYPTLSEDRIASAVSDLIPKIEAWGYTAQYAPKPKPTTVSNPEPTGASSNIQAIAQRHGVDANSLSAFVESTLNLSRIDNDQLSNLLTPLRLNWKDRAKVEENLMRDLLPVLNTRANGWQKIAGLDVWADSLDAPTLPLETAPSAPEAKPAGASRMTVKADSWGGSHITSTEKQHIKAGLEQGATEWKVGRKHYKIAGTKDGQTVVNIYDLPLKNGFGKPVDNADDAKPNSKALVSGAPVAPSAPAPAPVADPAQAIVDGMMALYRADDDGATERNDTGFNGFHTPYKYDGGVKQVKNEFVANMIERIEAGQTLTPNQLAACAKILTVYRKQLEKQHGVVLPTTEAIKAHVGGGNSASEFKGSMKLVGNEIHIERPYNKADVDKFRSIPGRRWDGSRKVNIIPVSAFKDALDQFPAGEMDIDPAIFEHSGIHEEPKRETAGAGVVHLKNGEYQVSFPFDRAMVARVKGITRRGKQLGKWDGNNKLWRFPGDDQTLAQIMNEFPEFDLRKSARHYTLAGVAYELRRVADRVFLKKVAHAF